MHERTEAEQRDDGLGHELAAGGLAQQANQLGRQQNGEQRDEGCASSAGEFAYDRTLKDQPRAILTFAEGNRDNREPDWTERSSTWNLA